MKKLLLSFFVTTLVLSQTCSNANQATTIDFSGASKYEGKNMNGLSCNQQTMIDFTFGSSAAGSLELQQATTAYNYLQFQSSNGDSNLRFLDVDGTNRSYSLNGISLVPSGNARIANFSTSTYTTHEISFTYKYQEGNVEEDTILVVYLTTDTNINTTATNAANVVPITSSQPNGVSSFRSLVNQVAGIINSATSGNITGLSSAFVPFQTLDYSKFYTVQTQNGCKTNFLISAFVYSVDSTNLTSLTPPTALYTYQTTTQVRTGNLLCYGSHTTGVFQTHMRQSYPLWAAWFGALFFWAFILFSEPNTALTLYDRKFQDNKWTSWEIFSVWHLSHEQYFTRMMRMTSIYVSFSIQCLVVACLYGELGTSMPDPITILWMGVIGGIAGFIFSYFLGFFLNGCYNWTLQKYNIKKKVKALQSKQSMEAQTYEGEIDRCEDKIYTYYYWYYVLSVIVIFVCWAISVHEMQKLPRQNYFQMWYWCGGTGLAFVLNAFVLSPILTAIFGNFRFYQYRGFWYNFELGQSFKEVQD